MNPTKRTVPLIHLVRRITLQCLAVPILAVACSGGSETTSDRATSASEPAAPTSQLRSSPSEGSERAITDLFSSLEGVAVELDQRSVDGSLTARWLEIWGNARALREPATMTRLITTIRQSGSAAQILGFDGAILNAYMDAFSPVIAELEEQSSTGVLDGNLVSLHTRLKAAAATFEQPGSSTNRKSRYCCEVNYRDPETIVQAAQEIYNKGENEDLYDWAVSILTGAKTLASGEMVPQALACYDWNTWSWWAHAKCALGNLAAPFALVPSLHGTECRNIVTCN